MELKRQLHLPHNNTGQFAMEKNRRPLERSAATFGSEALKEVPASEALRACTFSTILLVPVVVCKLDLVFCF